MSERGAGWRTAEVTAELLRSLARARQYCVWAQDPELQDTAVPEVLASLARRRMRCLGRRAGRVWAAFEGADVVPVLVPVLLALAAWA